MGKLWAQYNPKKAEPNQMHFTVRGDRITYRGKVATPTAEMLVVKMLFNSVISTKGICFMTMDISNFYLMTPLHQPKFICMKLSDIPDEVVDIYKLKEKATLDSSIYIKAKQDMYGLPQSGLLANKLLEKRLNKHGYRQSKLVPGLWRHATRPVQFTLVVDEFEVKYVDEEHGNHLKQVLDKHNTLTCDWTGTPNIGITLDWNYSIRQVHLSMSKYATKAIKQFQHIAQKRQYAPYLCVPIQYGAKKQYATQKLKALLLDEKAKLFIQQVCGKFLFLGRAVDSNLFCPISAIASQLSKPTEDTMRQTLQLLDYLATQEDTVLSYHTSNMVLAVHSNASYLSEPKACSSSRTDGHFFLSSNMTLPPSNEAVLINIAPIIKNVMSSATEAELVGL
jgi:hypothetical protein